MMREVEACQFAIRPNHIKNKNALNSELALLI